MTDYLILSPTKAMNLDTREITPWASSHGRVVPVVDDGIIVPDPERLLKSRRVGKRMFFYISWGTAGPLLWIDGEPVGLMYENEAREIEARFGRPTEWAETWS